MRSATRAGLAAVALGVAVALATGASSTVEPPVRSIAWVDVAPLQARLERYGITPSSFDARVAQIRERNAQRVREGDLDHLIFYLLQSTRFTKLPPIEPALSAKAYVDGGRVADEVRARTAAFVEAIDSSPSDARLSFFRDLLATLVTAQKAREDALLREYERVMRFVHEKEFVAQRSERPADAVAELYRSRGLSTDTAIEAGYLVHQGLGVLKGLDPGRRIRRVLIVGPGLDLAPRTGLIEAGPPESYQPWAVMDALFALGLSQPGDLEVVAADINPRVVAHLRRARATPPALTLVSGIRESETVTFSQEYRDYYARLGSAVGEVAADSGSTATGTLQKIVRVGSEAARALQPEQLDIVTERFQVEEFDLVIATNILPYFGDVELMLAMSNVAAMLAPNGAFVHNEARPLLRDIAADVHLPFEQSRHAIIATVRGAPAPLFDNVYLHRRTERPGGTGRN